MVNDSLGGMSVENTTLYYSTSFKSKDLRQINKKVAENEEGHS